MPSLLIESTDSLICSLLRVLNLILRMGKKIFTFEKCAFSGIGHQLLI